MPGCDVINHGITEQFDTLASVVSHNIGFHLRETGNFSNYTHGDILDLVSNAIGPEFRDYIVGCNYECWFNKRKMIDFQWSDTIEQGTRVEIRVALCNHNFAKFLFFLFCLCFLFLVCVLFAFEKRKKKKEKES